VAAATRHACSPGCGLSAAAWGYRSLPTNILTGTVPTELGTLTALTQLCVHRPLPPRLHVCTVTGLWAERGGVGIQVSTHQQSYGDGAHRAWHADCADPAVRAPPSPTAPARVHRHRAVG
jgi:hypothetical protein